MLGAQYQIHGPRDAPTVFVVVLSWNRRDTVLRCLAELGAIRYTNFRVLIVDNASDDGTPDAVALQFPDVEVLRSRQNVGYAGGVNIGMRHALENGAEFVWLLNDDATVPPETLQRLVDAARESVDIGALTPIVYYEDERTRIQVRGTFVDRRSAKVRSVDPDGEQPGLDQAPVLSGAAMLIRATAIRRVGMMDERLFAYWEDFDYSMRLGLAGFQLKVVTAAPIFHGHTARAGTGFDRPPHYYYLILRNQFFFWMRYKRGYLSRKVYFLAFLADAVEEAAMCRHHSRPDCADACLDAVWDALRGHGGPFVSRGHMPGALKRVLAWHPFFLGAVLRGKRPGAAPS